MSRLRNFVGIGPELMGMKYPKKWSDDLLDKFDREVKGSTDLYARVNGESDEERMETINGLKGATGAAETGVIDIPVFLQWQRTLLLASMSHTVHKTVKAGLSVSKEYLEKREKLYNLVKSLESSYPSLTKQFSADEAMKTAQWD